MRATSRLYPELTCNVPLLHRFRGYAARNDAKAISPHDVSTSEEIDISVRPTSLAVARQLSHTFRYSIDPSCAGRET